MTTTVITASSKATEHGHVHSVPKTRSKSPAQSAASLRTQPPIAHKNKHISRSSKQTKLPCYSNPSMTSSGSNYKQSLKEAWPSLPILTGRICWPLGKIRQVELKHNNPNRRITTSRRRKKSQKKILLQVICPSLRMIDLLYVYCYLFKFNIV